MNPDILELAQKVQLAEEQKEEIATLQPDQEALKLQKIAEHEQLLSDIHAIEQALILVSA
jgi:hypothetical protein